MLSSSEIASLPGIMRTFGACSMAGFRSQMTCGVIALRPAVLLLLPLLRSLRERRPQEFLLMLKFALFSVYVSARFSREVKERSSSI